MKQIIEFKLERFNSIAPGKIWGLYDQLPFPYRMNLHKMFNDLIDRDIEEQIAERVLDDR